MSTTHQLFEFRRSELGRRFLAEIQTEQRSNAACRAGNKTAVSRTLQMKWRTLNPGYSKTRASFVHEQYGGLSKYGTSTTKLSHLNSLRQHCAISKSNAMLLDLLAEPTQISLERKYLPCNITILPYLEKIINSKLFYLARVGSARSRGKCRTSSSCEALRFSSTRPTLASFVMMSFWMLDVVDDVVPGSGSDVNKFFTFCSNRGMIRSSEGSVLVLKQSSPPNGSIAGRIGYDHETRDRRESCGIGTVSDRVEAGKGASCLKSPIG